MQIRLAVASALAVFACLSVAAGASAATDPALLLFYKPAVTQVPDGMKNTLSVFRQTNPVVPPPVVQQYGLVDPVSGESFLGLNSALARPAYPLGAGPGKPHYWLMPAANNGLVGVELDKNGREVEDGGLFSLVDASFEKYGSFNTEPSIFKRGRSTTIRGLMPDSIKTFKIITKRARKRSLVKTYTVRDNTILLKLKRTPTYIVIRGKKFRVGLLGLPEDLGDGVQIGS